MCFWDGQDKSIDRYLRSGRSIESTSQIEDISVSGNSVRCKIAISTHSRPIADEFQDAIEERIQTQVAGVGDVQIEFAELDRPPVALGQIGLQAKTVMLGDQEAAKEYQPQGSF